MKNSPARLVIRCIIILIAIYCGFLAYLWAFQEHLIFFPHEMTLEEWEETSDALQADYVTIRVTRDGKHLQGWFIHDHSEDSRPTIIYFGGNAQRMNVMASILATLRDQGFNLLITDYRGYGLSEGKPSTAAFTHDAEILFEAAKRNPLVDPENIIVWGHSIGAGVATHLASTKPVSKVILFAPFTSTLDVAKESFPFVPEFVIDVMLRHKLDNLMLAPSIKQPALIVHGDADWQIDISHGKAVADAWGGEIEFYQAPGRDHNNLFSDDAVWEEVMQFVSE